MADGIHIHAGFSAQDIPSGTLPYSASNFDAHEFGEDIYRTACSAYLQHHDAPPGGTGNARLRKKRRKLVMDWFGDHLAEGTC